jgi:hypothetical protein
VLELGTRILYRDGVHLNEDGHYRATGEILGFLDERHLVPPARGG